MTKRQIALICYRKEYMAENDNKRFYWLKLKKDFFQQHQIKVLKSMPNGRLYALIYLELMTESTSHNGELRYNEMLPYDSVTLAAVIDEDKDNLEKAIEVLVGLGLVEILEDKTIYLTELHKLLGSETGQTARKREAREVKLTTTLPQDYQKNTLEYRDKSKEYRVKSKDNIFIKPSIEELESYCKEKGFEVDAEHFYNYYESNGWKVGRVPMKSWKAALCNWNKNYINAHSTLKVNNVAIKPDFSKMKGGWQK